MLEQIRNNKGQFVVGHVSTRQAAWTGLNICPLCNTSFDVDSQNKKQKYCSRSCMAQAYKKEVKEHNLIERTCFGCGSIYRTWPSHNKRYCSKTCKRGDKHPMWRGGDSKSYRLQYSTAIHHNWRKAVFERDNYTCQRCGQRGGYLEAHHDLPSAFYPAVRYEVLNGVTLCRECHALTKSGAKIMRVIWF